GPAGNRAPRQVSFNAAVALYCRCTAASVAPTVSLPSLGAMANAPPMRVSVVDSTARPVAFMLKDALWPLWFPPTRAVVVSKASDDRFVESTNAAAAHRDCRVARAANPTGAVDRGVPSRDVGSRPPKL